MTGPLLGADQLRQLLTELGAGLAERGVEAHLFVVGGAAMALAYNRERVTRDIDAVFEPNETVYEEAARVAEAHRLPPSWLNDAVKGLLPPAPDGAVGTTFAAPGIAVQIASAEYLFAMKAAAARAETDGDDLRLLADEIGVRTAADGVAILTRYYGAERLLPRSSLLLEELFGT